MVLSRSRRVVVALVAALLVAPLAAARSLPLPSPASVETINATELRLHLGFLSSPEVGGRYTLGPGIQVAARYLASRLESYGYRGAGPDGSFFQPYELETLKVDPAKSSVELTIGGKTERIVYGDFATFSESEGEATGQVVFAGYGISSKSQNHDDYAGLDVRGKIVFVASGTPEGVDSSKVSEAEQGAEAAQAHGAKALLSLPPQRYVQFLSSAAARDYILRHENVRLKKSKAEGIPSAVLKPDAADRLLALVGLTSAQVFEVASKGGALAPRPVDATARVSIAVQATTQTAQNVVAVLEGSDPKLRDEYVALSAHFDHLKANAKGEYYPGADDDGSGTAAVLTLARAFAVERAKRSIFVIFHSGEEMGLLGSQYNADVAPAVPIDRIVANLNIDMIGRSRAAGDTDPRNAELTDANSVYLIGSDKLSTELHRLSEQTNAETARMRLDYTYNDPNHPQQFYYRSDHWNYAKHGVPVIFYFSGVHADYHQPTDTIDKIDFEKLTRVARLVHATAWRIANLEHRLAVDKK